MGRNIRTAIPILPQNLMPKWPKHKEVQQNDAKLKHKSKFYFDRRHNTSSLPLLGPGDPVRLKTDKQKTWNQMGTVADADHDRRSYLVSTPEGEYVRNRKHLQLLPNAETDCDASKSKPETPTEPQTPQLPQTSESVKTPVKTPIKELSKPETTKTESRHSSGRISKKPDWLKDFVTN